MTKGNVYLLLAALAVGAFVAGAIDTSDYRNAVKALEYEGVQVNLRVHKVHTDDDLNRYAQCNSMRILDPVTHVTAASPPYRECLINNAPQTITASGALIFASAALEWLVAHEGDKEVTEAAMEALRNGRLSLYGMKAWYYDGLNLVNEANNQSYVRRWLFGEKPSYDAFVKMADLLSKAELQVLSPGTAKRQSEWLLDALKPKS